MDIEIVFDNGNAGGRGGANGRLHILDRVIAARPRVNDIPHPDARRPRPRQADIARLEAVIGQGLDLDLQRIGIPGMAAAIQDDVGEAELGIAADARRIDFRIRNGAQADMRRIRAFARHAVASLRPGGERRCRQRGTRSAQQCAAVDDGHAALPAILGKLRPKLAPATLP